MESRGDVSSIKFSPDRRILAVQRSPKSVVNKTPCHTFYGKSFSDLPILVGRDQGCIVN